MTDWADEHEVVERAARGDPAAIGWLYQRYAPAIFRYLFYRLGSREVAEDNTSEVFVRALESLPRYRSQGRPFVVWLYRIAGARVADYYRRHRRRVTVPLEAEAPDRRADPVEALESRLTAEVVQQAVARLTPLQQQVLVLRFLEGLPHGEVARIMGRSEGAVRVLQFRALETLRRVLEQEQGG